MSLARRLAGPGPGWTTTADVVVVGSGIAGLTAALRIRERGPRVLLITKSVLASGSTVWAQGGIAAALDPRDTSDAHLADTLVAGAGLCDPAAVEVLVTEGPGRVRELAGLGAAFDLDAAGEISLTREGGHGTRRIAHGVAVAVVDGLEVIQVHIRDRQRPLIPPRPVYFDVNGFKK